MRGAFFLTATESQGHAYNPRMQEMNDQAHAEALATARINIARLEVQVGNLTQGMADLQESNQQLTAKLDQVLLTLSEARGGWKTLMVVGGAASTMGAGIAWLLQHWPTR